VPRPDGGPRQGAPSGPGGGPRGPGAGPAKGGTPPTIRAHSPDAEDGPQGHGAEPMEVRDRPRGAKQRLRRPAHGEGGDGRDGEVVVFRAHRPAWTAARVGPAPGQRKTARLRRTGRTARSGEQPAGARRRAGWRYKIAPGREAAAPGRPHQPPLRDGGGDSGAVPEPATAAAPASIRVSAPHLPV
jgi:hypothetical protein